MDWIQYLITKQQKVDAQSERRYIFHRVLQISSQCQCSSWQTLTSRGGVSRMVYKNSMLELAMQINALGAVDGGSSECRHCSRGLLCASLSLSAARRSARALFSECVCTCFIMILVRCNGISTGRQRQRDEAKYIVHPSHPPPIPLTLLCPRRYNTLHCQQFQPLWYASGQHICIQSMHRFMHARPPYVDESTHHAHSGERERENRKKTSAAQHPAHVLSLCCCRCIFARIPQPSLCIIQRHGRACCAVFVLSGACSVPRHCSQMSTKFNISLLFQDIISFVDVRHYSDIWSFALWARGCGCGVLPYFPWLLWYLSKILMNNALQELTPVFI